MTKVTKLEKEVEKYNSIHKTYFYPFRCVYCGHKGSSRDLITFSCAGDFDGNTYCPKCLQEINDEDGTDCFGIRITSITYIKWIVRKLTFYCFRKRKENYF